MSEPIRLTTPFSEQDVRTLKAGDTVLLSGVIYTGRDAAHKRLYELLQAGKELPVDLKGQVIYYVGPTPAKPGQVIGSAGPTTSGRMDAYAPTLIAYGLRGMIGKGLRNQAVIDAMKEHGAVYLGATGGAAALLAKRITACEVVAYEDLGTEAIRRLVVVDFPLIVVNDSHGGDFYREGVKLYERVSPG
ncbi:MAG TPA: Fe-S-containing hydro-lyase [Armatimonadota bacterium]|jgi:fumarate hydratase subunit beta|nr:Fe-S-containing hydro-lyase [Armatimonadota bacterium]HOP80943.1 Fe-S-containing hydro-lyase [Armatimonadota bacterium]